jgi:TPR repeat protein
LEPTTPQHFFDIGRDYGSPAIEAWEEAARRWKIAAEMGHARAQSCLGSMYSKGEGVPEDQAAATMWIRRAAEQGDVDAQTNLGIRLLAGRGERQNESEGLNWLALASRNGSTHAARALSEFRSAHPNLKDLMRRRGPQ